VHSVENIRLKKIRYNLRTVLRLAFDEKLKSFNEEISKVQGIESLDYLEKEVALRKIFKRKEDLIIRKQRSPINCVVCGERMEDLFYISSNASWRCILCYRDWISESVHEKIIS